MAKINNFLIKYKEILKDVKINFEGKKPPKFIIKRFITIIKEKVTDQRYENMCDYPLDTILVCAFLAILCNNSNWIELHDFAYDNRKWLSKFVYFPDGKVPSHDTFRRVFGLIDSTELANATKDYLISIFTKIKNAIKKYESKTKIDSMDNHYKKILINIDGKEARGTGRFYDDKNKKVHNLHTLNVYNASDGITIMSRAIDSKENEIPVAQSIIKTLNLNNKIVTLDALHAQHKTFYLISKQGGDYLIGLKGNQGDALEEINLLLTSSYFNKFKKTNKNYYSITEGETKIKEFYLISFESFAFSEGETSDGIKKWYNAKNIIVYNHPNKKTGEIITQYFITSLIDIEECVEAIIGRWDIENLLHRYLDMAFYEDMNKTMDKDAFNNFSIMNKLCLSLLKLAKPFIFNRSIIRLRKSFARKPVQYLFTILAILDIDEIEKALN